MSVTPRRRFEVLKRDGFRCTYCGASDRLEVDHVIPRSAGGTDDDGNLTTSCWECNRGKAHNEIPGINPLAPGDVTTLILPFILRFEEHIRSTSSINMQILMTAARAVAVLLAGADDVTGTGNARKRYNAYWGRLVSAMYRAEKELDGARVWTGGGNAHVDAMLVSMGEPEVHE